MVSAEAVIVAFLIVAVLAGVATPSLYLCRDGENSISSGSYPEDSWCKSKSRNSINWYMMFEDDNAIILFCRVNTYESGESYNTNQ